MRSEFGASLTFLGNGVSWIGVSRTLRWALPEGLWSVTAFTHLPALEALFVALGSRRVTARTVRLAKRFRYCPGVIVMTASAPVESVIVQLPSADLDVDVLTSQRAFAPPAGSAGTFVIQQI